MMYKDLDVIDLLIDEEPRNYVYVYESHMGDIYITSKERKEEELRCNTCGDIDMLIDRGGREELLKRYWKEYYNKIRG